MYKQPRDYNSTLERKVSETVLILHLYSVSFGRASAERKVEFVAEIGGCHSTSLNLFSQGSGLFCLCTTPETRERLKSCLSMTAVILRVTGYLFHRR